MSNVSDTWPRPHLLGYAQCQPVTTDVPPFKTRLSRSSTMPAVCPNSPSVGRRSDVPPRLDASLFRTPASTADWLLSSGGLATLSTFT
ncbi:hypothetical protein PoB_001353000 [Plakobranchus ocellatus]|uniref:Uncharacterized protein n=1 Tax=Plakobranchus ocellatus TaxID=259542 RepID=A0AAV3YX31_9GAST|nr:hypothetical protein PoB_001353000 [Plakobranchus ocellatus]